MNLKSSGLGLSHAIHAAVVILFCAAMAATICGCTAPSTTMAIKGSDDSDAIRTAVVQRQHDGLKVLLYRDTLAKLNAAKTDEERSAILNAAWNERDLVEFWFNQDTLARCLHFATVDAKLATSQAMFDLIFKNLARSAKKPLQAVDDYMAAQLATGLLSSQTDQAATAAE
jgi:hypothetical protein